MTDPERPSPRRRRDPGAARARNAEIEDPAVVLGAGLRFLESRPRSISEVRRRLMTAGYRGDLIDGAIERLTDLGMLDDAAFARAWLESRDRAHPRGEAALRRELRLKGIDHGLAAALLDERRAGDGDPDMPDVNLAAARGLLGRRGRAFERESDPRKRRSRAWALLARHGFSPDVIGGAIRAWETAHAEAAAGDGADAFEEDPGPDPE